MGGGYIYIYDPAPSGPPPLHLNGNGVPHSPCGVDYGMDKGSSSYGVVNGSIGLWNRMTYFTNYYVLR